MRKLILGLFSILFFSQFSLAQGIPYQLFDAKGKAVKFEQLIKDCKSANLVFFGELHNNSLAHWLQLQVLMELAKGNDRLVFGSEIFERDDQLIIDEWMSGKITEKNFEAEAKLWKNYLTDYKPLMLFAKNHQIPVVASNVPRRYASLVSRDGINALDSLTAEAKSYLARLPIMIDMKLPGYEAMRGMMHGAPGNADYMIQAQALKDATMAESLFSAIRGGKQVFHVNGSYHSKEGEGILWYLKREFPDLKILNIHTVEQDQLDHLDEVNSKGGEYILVLPKDSPKSY